MIPTMPQPLQHIGNQASINAALREAVAHGLTKA
jgi:hypothetical protein